MRYSLFNNRKDELILVARVLLMALFIIFGWGKITAFSATIGYMQSLGTPAPALAAMVAIAMELFVGIAIAVGFYTRPLAFLFALYTVATALIGHQFWSMTGDAFRANEINFFKNVSIMGGLLLLCVTGPGKYSFDRK
jgi:putative oxidoreductase